MEKDVERLIIKVNGEYTNRMVLSMVDEMLKEIENEVMDMKDFVKIQQFREWIDEYTQEQFRTMCKAGIDLETLVRKAMEAKE